MSNAKIVSMIAHATSQVRHDDERARMALAVDLYDALRAMIVPLADRIDALEAEIERWKASMAGIEPYDHERKANEAANGEAPEGEGEGATAHQQGREGQEYAKEAGSATAEPLTINRDPQPHWRR